MKKQIILLLIVLGLGSSTNLVKASHPLDDFLDLIIKLTRQLHGMIYIQE